MKFKNYFIISALSFLAFSCQDEERGSAPLASGDEVTFGVTLEQNTATRTIYGQEANNAFPIYWVNGDEVIVSSSDCENAGGVGSATYRVAVESPEQNYASSLDKTGDIGVRWGDNETADFYSVYPASHAVVGSDYSTVTLTMPAQQDNGYDKNTMKVQPDMNACFMYAVTEGVKSGETVNLHYKPLSTAVRFKLTGPESGEVSINYVRIFAPEGTNINGTYTADFSQRDENGCPKMTATHGLNYITFNVADENNTYLTLADGASIEVNAFLLLEGKTEITDKWYIEIGTTAGISFKKDLEADPGAADNRTLVPGMIHRLPDLPPLSDTSGEWEASNWMSNLQKNVYLSEISIPGSWNSLNFDYQEPYAIQGQYDAGIRAFHLDTRWKAKNTGFIISNWEITDVLGIANGGSTADVDGDDGVEGKCMTDDAPSFEDALTQITDNVKDDEYMVVICTFAQGSAQHSDWRKAISDACAKNDKVIDASTLTQNTVVADVLGYVIVIVNTYTQGEVADSKCLYFNMGMTLNQSEFTGNPYYQVPLTARNVTNTGVMIYGTHAQITTENNSYNDTDRGYVPSLAERWGKVQNILNWSQNNYKDIANYAHNAWMYIGLGGYIPGNGIPVIGTDDDPGTVGDYLNNEFNGIVTAMETNDSYYPVGIVLMNHANTYSYMANDILQLNNKYRKAYDPNRSPIDGSYINGEGGRTVQSTAPGYSSGMTDNQTDAIGWTRCR